MKNIFFVLFIVVHLNIHSQGSSDGFNFDSYYINPVENTVPKTPTAAVFDVYGNIPLNTSSGLPNISIPIYNIEEDGVSIPISLSYHASGVRVDEFSSTVGLKWALNAGGSISRTIIDYDDFGTNFYSSFGWINNKEYSDFHTWALANPYYDYDSSFRQGEISELINLWDNWPDEFDYNFLNFSGSFVFKPNGTILNSVKNELDFQIYNESNFTLADQSGNFYEFIPGDVNEKRTIVYDNIDLLREMENSSSENVSWVLHKITTRNGKTINFEYNNYTGFNYDNNPISQQIVWEEIGSVCDPDNMYLGTRLVQTKVESKNSGKLISKISTETIEVTFQYDNSNTLNGQSISDWFRRVTKIIIKDKIENKQKEFVLNYGLFGGGRLKLISVQEKGFDGVSLPPYEFTYNENHPLPSYGSLAKDYKGFYNGKINNSLFPKSKATLDYSNYHQDHIGYYGLLSDRYFDEDFLKVGVLTEIKYPTGGKTVFEYEVNAIGENTNEPLINGDNYTNIGNSETSFFHYSGNTINGDSNYEVFNSLVTFKDVTGRFLLESLNDCPNCFGEPNSDVPIIQIYEWHGSDILTSESQILSNRGQLSLARSLYVGTSSFPMYLLLQNDLIISDINGKYLIQLKVPKTVHNTVPKPNIVASIEWHNLVKNSNNEIQYQKNYLGGLRVASIKDYDETNLIKKTTYDYKSAYFLDDYNTDNYNFSSAEDGEKIILTADKTEIPYGKTITGYTFTEVHIKKEGVTDIGIEIEKYEPDFSFNSIRGGSLTTRIVKNNEEDIITFMERDYYEENLDQLSFWNPTKMDKRYVVWEMCGNPPVLVFNTKFGYSNFYPTYHYYTKAKYLVSEKSTEFFKRGSTFYPVTTIKNYQYNDDLLVTQETVDTRYTGNFDTNEEMVYSLTNPDGEVIKVEYTYPKDHLPHTQNLLNKLLVSIPISKKVENKSLKILGQYFVYDNNGNINKTFQYNKGKRSNSYGSYVPSDYEEINSYEFLNGKPVQTQTKGGTPISYLWGYKNTYPVAKIEGAAYTEIIGVSGLNMSIIDNPNSDLALQSELNKIRNALTGAMVTTYTYKPLVGVSSITDPKGDKIKYVYDGFGKLNYIEDNYGNKLEEYEYHYRED